MLSNEESYLEHNEKSIEPSQKLPSTHIGKKVSKNESIYTLAEEFGLLWTDIWNDPLNRDLKFVRKDPHALMSGDVVAIKCLKVKKTPCATKERHSFTKFGVPKYIAMKLVKFGEPLAGEPYVININGKKTEGILDDEGGFIEIVPLNATMATLTVGEGVFADHYELSLAGLNPIESVSGIKQRLQNLGLLAGNCTEPETFRAAILRFQNLFCMETTGVADAQFIQKLKEKHGS